MCRHVTIHKSFRQLIPPSPAVLQPISRFLSGHALLAPSHSTLCTTSTTPLHNQTSYILLKGLDQTELIQAFSAAYQIQSWSHSQDPNLVWSYLPSLWRFFGIRPVLSYLSTKPQNSPISYSTFLLRPIYPHNLILVQEVHPVY